MKKNININWSDFQLLQSNETQKETKNWMKFDFILKKNEKKGSVTIGSECWEKTVLLGEVNGSEKESEVTRRQNLEGNSSFDWMLSLFQIIGKIIYLKRY